jgi:hypothetical protein
VFGSMSVLIKGMEAPSLHEATSHWLHVNSIPNIGCHYFWPGLIALPKNTLDLLVIPSLPYPKVRLVNK